MIFSDTTDISNGFVQQCWLAYKGNNRWPSAGADKYNRILMIANRKIEEWARDANVNWRSLWSDDNLTTVLADTQNYNLPATVIRTSDYVYVDIDGLPHAQYKVVPPAQRDAYPYSCYVQGVNPPILTFNFDINTGDPIVGGTIRLATYKVPDALEDTTDEIPVDDPTWLVYEVAAELARNDPAKDDQFGNLAGIANDKYQKMIRNNNKVGFAQPGGAPIQQFRI